MRLGIHYALVALYAILPFGMIAWATLRNRRGQAAPLFTLTFTFLGGIAIGIAVAVLNARLMGGRMPASELLRLIYASIAALCLLKLIDRLLRRGLFRLSRVPLDNFGRPISPNAPRALLALLVQRLLMLGIILPYAFALLLIYRPHILHDGCTPRLLGLKYSPASFTAADGVKLAGWWIPAAPSDDDPDTWDESPSLRTPSADPAIQEQWGQRTVILCHGVGGGKESQLGLAWLLAKRGFNVLAFDFRGHGQSGGNFISYGDLERQDVLAAVRWAKSNHPQQSQRIFGIGVNTGAAALLAAAADQHDGQSIDAIILDEPFARFQSLANYGTEHVLPRGLAWLVRNISLPIAALHSGAKIDGFSPIDYADRIWPRPVLVIHGRGGTFIPTAEEMDLYQQLPQPKEQFWPADNYRETRARRHKYNGDDTALLIHMFRHWMGQRDNVSTDAGAQYRMLQFLREAQRKPVI